MWTPEEVCFRRRLGCSLAGVIAAASVGLAGISAEHGSPRKTNTAKATRVEFRKKHEEHGGREGKIKQEEHRDRKGRLSGVNRVAGGGVERKGVWGRGTRP